MPQPDLSALPGHISQIETLRDSRVLVLAASHLDIELLPALFDQCTDIGPTPRLDVVLHGRGGVVNAARRIALLLRRQTGHLAFIVPFHCQSSATLLTLCADEIIAGELAQFSPIDPQLNGADGSSFSGLDIQHFGAMAETWFGLESEQARAESLALLCQSVFPPSLTAFYRTTLELAQIGEELLAWQLPGHDEASRRKIVSQLMSGYHSHNYALEGADLEKLGLQVRRNAKVEQVAWEISKLLQGSVGGALRNAPDEAYNDAMLATRDAVMVRRKRPGGMGADWTAKPSQA